MAFVSSCRIVCARVGGVVHTGSVVLSVSDWRVFADKEENFGEKTECDLSFVIAKELLVLISQSAQQQTRLLSVPFEAWSWK